MNRIFISVICFLVISTSLRAERLFQILHFGFSSNASDELELYVNAEVNQQIELTKNRFSPTYKIKDSGQLTLTVTDKVYTDPKEIEGFPTVVIDKSWENFILLAFSDPKNKLLPIRLVAMELGSDFKTGDFRFINFSNNNFAVRVGSKTAQLKPQGMKTLGDFAAQNQDIRMQANWWKSETESWRPLANQLVRYEKNIRIMFFVYSPPGSNRPTYLTAGIRGL